jgi:hypothetical protein
MPVLKLNAFKFEDALPERVQVDRISSSTLEMKQQVRGADEFSAPTTTT